MDATGRTVDGRKHTASLEHAVKFAGWITPTANKSQHVSADAMEREAERQQESLLVQAYGTTPPSGSPASTAERGALNPAFVRWLMGFPPEWDAYAPTATRSSRRSPRSS